MVKVPLAIVGCGGMGGRHLLGLKELFDAGLSTVDLIAVCDLRSDNANRLADNAKELLGKRPKVYSDIATMKRELGDLLAVDITTDAGSHHKVSQIAFDLGLHVFCEKPLALTIRGCNKILEAQKRSGKLLSVAENYRRDPMGRLTKALLDAGVIGKPYMHFDIGASSGNTIIILPWRHDRNVGGILLDGGVHNADMMMYYLGDVEQVYAKVNRWEDTRYKPNSKGSLSTYYQPWYDEMPEKIQATAEDALVSVINFKNGVVGQWTSFYAAHGKGLGIGTIYGSQGSLQVGGIRSGHAPVLNIDGKEEITGDALLDLVPGFHLDEITTALFHGDRMGSYNIPFPEADRKLLAIELYEIGKCITSGEKPEVDGLVGRKDIALCYAAFESSVLNRPVTITEIETEQTGQYEAEINTHWKI